MASTNTIFPDAAQFYWKVFNEVLNEVREEFSEEGIDENGFQCFKIYWFTKLIETKAVDMSSVAPELCASCGYSNENQTEPLTQPLTQPLSHTLIETPTPPLTLPLIQQSEHVFKIPMLSYSKHQPFNIQTTGQKITAIYSMPNVVFEASGVCYTVDAKPVSSLCYRIEALITCHPIHKNVSTTVCARNEPTPQPPQRVLLQLDGTDDDSSDESDYESRDDDDECEDSSDEVDNEGQGEDEEPLNSGDDISDNESDTDEEDIDNIVCLFEKITRVRNKWRLQLKNCIMNIDGKDYIFHKTNIEVDW